jgi:hypothetical protein
LCAEREVAGKGISPLLEIDRAFRGPVNEFHDFVGTRNLTGRLPTLHNLDFTLARPWRIKGRRFGPD